MSVLDALRIAIRAIISNRLRSALTLLGLIIGVSSVIALIAVGQGTQKGITEQIQGLGLNLIFVEPSVGAAAGGAGALNILTYGDSQAILANNDPEITDVAAHLQGNGQAIAGTNDVAAEVVFTWSNYAGVVDVEVANGVFVAPAHDDQGQLVAVLGADMAEALFDESDPIGQEMRISFFGGQVTIPFTVIGVMEHVGQDGANVVNRQIFVGASGLANRFRQFFYTPEGDIRVTGIVIQTVDNADTERIKTQVEELLLLRHGDPEPRFTVESQDEL
ncbi:MAG: ABC transporter permease, partial [Chloroflexi bacterium]|nr:ABC transporter permease [Chloroflexota bacterium]